MYIKLIINNLDKSNSQIYNLYIRNSKEIKSTNQQKDN